MEKLLTSENLDKITLSDMEKTRADEFKVHDCKKNSVEAGDKIFKVVDNKEWFLAAWLSSDDAEGFEAGNNVKVDFHDGVRPQDESKIRDGRKRQAESDPFL